MGSVSVRKASSNSGQYKNSKHWYPSYCISYNNVVTNWFQDYFHVHVHINMFSLQRVIEVSKEYLPTMAIGYKDPRVKVHVQDGAEFLVDHKESFDIIITDSSDPIGWWVHCYNNYY